LIKEPSGRIHPPEGLIILNPWNGSAQTRSRQLWIQNDIRASPRQVPTSWAQAENPVHEF